MGNRFSISGTIEKASSGRSLKIQMVNLRGCDYVGIEDLEAVIKGRKKTVTIWRPNPNPYKPRYGR